MQVYDNEWYHPVHRGHREVCCDCGLVHITDFKVVRGKVFIRTRRDDARTKKVRREAVRRQARGTARVAGT